MRSWTGKPWCAVSVALIVASDYDEANWRESRESGEDERKQDWWKIVVKKANRARRAKIKDPPASTEQHIIGVHTRKDIKTKFVASEPLAVEPVPKATLRRLRGYYDRAEQDAIADAAWVLKRIEQYNQAK